EIVALAFHLPRTHENRPVAVNDQPLEVRRGEMEAGRRQVEFQRAARNGAVLRVLDREAEITLAAASGGNRSSSGDIATFRVNDCSLGGCTPQQRRLRR